MAGAEILLTQTETEFLKERGTKLRFIKNWDLLDPVNDSPTVNNEPRQLVSLMSNCGNLVNGCCVAYEETRRPQVCRLFPVGSDACKKFRSTHVGRDNPSLARLGEYLSGFAT